MKGILLVNKKKGYSSFQTLSAIKRILKIKKAGYVGTLDPIATGLLPICIGRSTKLVDFLVGKEKEYVMDIKLGIQTDSDDITGNIIKKTDNISFNEKEIREIVLSFGGEMEQLPPKFSAKKVDGKRAYALARNNIDFKLKPVLVKISKIELINFNKKENTIRVRVCASKGFYARSLARDIGEKLGVGACMTDLIRTRMGNFTIDKAYTVEDIKAGKYNIINEYDALNFMQDILVVDKFIPMVINGNNRFFSSVITRFKNGYYKLIDLDKNVIAIAIANNGSISFARVLGYDKGK